MHVVENTTSSCAHGLVLMACCGIVWKCSPTLIFSEIIPGDSSSDDVGVMVRGAGFELATYVAKSGAPEFRCNEICNNDLFSVGFVRVNAAR